MRCNLKDYIAFLFLVLQKNNKMTPSKVEVVKTICSVKDTKIFENISSYLWKKL